MTGLYVTTYPITWIAILACVLCSLLILLMHKRFITGLIPGLIRLVVWSRKAYFSVGEFILKIVGTCYHTIIPIFVWSRRVYSPVGELILKLVGICYHTNQNTEEGGLTESIGKQQPQEPDNEQADSDAKALAVMPSSDAKDSLIASPPTSAHMITIDRSKDDGGSTSGLH